MKDRWLLYVRGHVVSVDNGNEEMVLNLGIYKMHFSL